MGRDIAGWKDRDGRMGGCETQIVGGVTSLRFGGQLLLLLFPPFALRRVEVLPSLLFPILSVSTACIGFRFGSAASFHFPGNVGLGLRTSDWQQQQNKPLPGLLMKQISLFAVNTHVSLSAVKPTRSLGRLRCVLNEAAAPLGGLRCVQIETSSKVG